MLAVPTVELLFYDGATFDVIGWTSHVDGRWMLTLSFGSGLAQLHAFSRGKRPRQYSPSLGHAALFVPDHKAVPSVPGHKKNRSAVFFSEMMLLKGLAFFFRECDVQFQH